MNKVILLGNLCKDIELRYTQSNKMVTQNTIAVRNDFKNTNGEYESQFINIVIWEKKAEYLKNYASKGSRILLEGRLTTRTYEKDNGEKRYITEVQVENLQILDGRKKEESNNKVQSPHETKEEKDPFGEFGEQLELSDDELLY